MMRRDSLSALPVPQKVGDGQSDVCVYMGGGGTQGSPSAFTTLSVRSGGA